MNWWARLRDTLLGTGSRLRQEIAARKLAERQRQRSLRDNEALAEQVQQLRADLADCRMRAEVDTATLRHIAQLAADPLTDAQYRARVDAALAGQPEGGDPC